MANNERNEQREPSSPLEWPSRDVRRQSQKSGTLNRIRIVLAEHDLNNKWLADKLGKDQATISKWVTNTTQPSLEALIAIANALEVPVQELVRQEEFNQEK